MGTLKSNLRLCGLVLIVSMPIAATANGLGENRSWQFRTDMERSALAGVADMVERKRGGYYDGFTTVVNNTSHTNIGTQINCSNGANAIGNSADNGQSGNTSDIDTNSENDADSLGNEAAASTSGDSGQMNSDQDNSGTVSAESNGNQTDIVTGSSSGGSMDAVLNNDQDNSGNQAAEVSESIACGMDGAAVSGDVVSNSNEGATAPLN